MTMTDACAVNSFDLSLIKRKCSDENACLEMLLFILVSLRFGKRWAKGRIGYMHSLQKNKKRMQHVYSATLDVRGFFHKESYSILKMSIIYMP